MGDSLDDAAGDRVAQGKAGHLPGLADDRFFEPWIGLGLYLLVGENRLGRRRGRGAAVAARNSKPPTILLSTPTTSSKPTTATSTAWRPIQPCAGGLPVVAGNSISLMNDTDMVINRLDRRH